MAQGNIVERRAGPRKKVRLRVRFWNGEVEGTGFTGDVSADGLFIETRKTLSPGTRLHIELARPDGPFFAECEVARVHKVPASASGIIPGGMGVRFIAWREAIGLDDSETVQAPSSIDVNLSDIEQLRRVLEEELEHGGLFLPVSPAPEIGAVVSLHVALPGAHGAVNVTARVVFVSEAPVGFGLQLNDDEALRGKLRAIISEADGSADTGTVSDAGLSTDAPLAIGARFRLRITSRGQPVSAECLVQRLELAEANDPAAVLTLLTGDSALAPVPPPAPLTTPAPDEDTSPSPVEWLPTQPGAPAGVSAPPPAAAAPPPAAAEPPPAVAEPPPAVAEPPPAAAEPPAAVAEPPAAVAEPPPAAAEPPPAAPEPPPAAPEPPPAAAEPPPAAAESADAPAASEGASATIALPGAVERAGQNLRPAPAEGSLMTTVMPGTAAVSAAAPDAVLPPEVPVPAASESAPEPTAMATPAAFSVPPPPVPEPVLEPVPEPIPEAGPEPFPEPGHEAFPDPGPEPVSEPVGEDAAEAHAGLPLTHPPDPRTRDAELEDALRSFVTSDGDSKPPVLEPLPPAEPGTLPVDLRDMSEFHKVLLSDLAMGGLFVPTSQPASLSDRVTVVLYLPAPHAPMHVQAVVVHQVDEPAGLGLQLTDPDEVVARLREMGLSG